MLTFFNGGQERFCDGISRRSFLSVGSLALGGLLVGLPATAALAADAEPTTAGEAQAKADDYREQADHYRAQGGVGYNTGRVQAAEAQAAKYSALAEQLSAPPDAAAPPPSPEVEHYAELAKHYRAQGGVTYKVGLLQWAEAQQRKAEAQQEAQVKQQQKDEAAPVPAAPSTDAPNSGP
jgi:hypothetical protein